MSADRGFFCTFKCGHQWALDAIEATTPALHVWCERHLRWSKIGELECEVCKPPPPQPKRRGPGRPRKADGGG